VTLYVSENKVRYEGVAEVNVADEVRSIERSSILDFSDNSQAFLNTDDSSYILAFYEFEDNPGNTESAPDAQAVSNSRIRIAKSDETKSIGDFPNCRKLRIINTPDKAKSSSGRDSTPVISGEIWLAEEKETEPLVGNYYQELSAYLNDGKFPGLELWRVLKTLDVPVEVIRTVLQSLEGVIVRADLEVERYSLGKKARIKIEVELENLEERRIARNKLEIPPEFHQALQE